MSDSNYWKLGCDSFLFFSWPSSGYTKVLSHRLYHQILTWVLPAVCDGCSQGFSAHGIRRYPGACSLWRAGFHRRAEPWCEQEAERWHCFHPGVKAVHLQVPLLPQVPWFKALGLWMERNHLLDESYGVESCMNFRVPNILFIAYLRRNCGSKTSCQFNGQCLWVLDYLCDLVGLVSYLPWQGIVATVWFDS